MKNILFKLIILITLSIPNLHAACLGDAQATLFDLGGGEGIDSIQIVGDDAYVSLSYEDELKGVAKINITNPSTDFKAYDFLGDNPYDYNKTAYLKAISNITTLYKYGSEFTFDGATLDSYASFRVNHVVPLGDKVSVYGYTNDSTDAYIWKLDITTAGTVTPIFTKLTNQKIYAQYNDENTSYYLLFSSDNTNLKLISSAFGDNFASTMNDLHSAETGTTGYISASLVKGSDSIFYMQIGNKVSKFDAANGSVTDISSLLPDNITKLLHATCSHVFYSSNFSDFNITNIVTGESGGVSTWDPYNGILVNNIFYLTNMGAMVNQIDVSDPLHPTVENNTTGWGHTDDVAYSGGHLYVASGWAGISVYDTLSCTSSVTTPVYVCSQSPDTNDTNTTPSDTCCFTQNDFDALPNGWSLVGTGCDINNTTIFSGAISVWSWNSATKRWNAYSPDTSLANVIQNTTDLDTLEKIGPKEGFWIYK